ncbi:MAG TPA: single-stranded DNA-binding protein [Candidatus Saccharibacteria bacterium]|nr:single-stranded DNA-binding protein [Candidatus Saccharibacteria bacterium]
MFSEFGRVGRDATLRYTPSGTAVAEIALAYEYGRKDQQTGKKPTQWIEVTMWGKTAEALSQYLTKGKQVFIEAKDVHIQTYDKNDGTQGFKLAAEFVGIKFANDGQQQSQAPAQQQQRPAQQQSQQAAPPDHNTFDDDIPFNTAYSGRKALLI